MPAQSFWPVCLVEGESMRRTYELMHSTEYISKGLILETVETITFRATYVFVYIYIYIYRESASRFWNSAQYVEAARNKLNP